MRASRLLSLLLLLQTRGRMTAQQLAGELEVSVRTIYRDVEALERGWHPAVRRRRARGGYQLLGGYRTRLTGLTAAEAEALFLSGLPGPAAELGLGSVLAAATLKLRAALPASLRENADRLSERFYLDAPGWYRRPADVPHLPAVASAVWDRQVIQVTYQRWKEPTEVTRRLEPHGLVLKAGTWYVVARCDGAMRTYRVDQIVAVTPCGCGFTAEPGFELAGYWHAYLADFRRQLHTGHAVIRLSGERRPAHASSAQRRGRDRGRDRRNHRRRTAGCRARVPIESPDHALADFLRLGADIEILEPAELREQAARTIRAMAAVYGQPALSATRSGATG